MSGPAGPLVAHLLYEKVPHRIAALVWGRDHEKEACAAYCQQTSRTVAAWGLTLGGCGYIGCSPDGFVYDGAQQGLLEIKCPFSARMMTVEEACLSISDFFCSLDPHGKPLL